MPICDERICRRVERLLTFKINRLGTELRDENGNVPLDQIIQLPLFSHYGTTIEQLATTLNNDEKSRFTVEDNGVRLTNPPPERNKIHQINHDGPMLNRYRDLARSHIQREE